MNSLKFQKNFKKIIKYLFYFFIFTLPLQTKLILLSAETNYSEISLYFNYLILIIVFLLFLIYLFKYQTNAFKNNFVFDRYWIALIALEFFFFLSLLFSANRPLSVFKYLILLLAIALMFLALNFKFKLKKIITVFLLALLLQALLGFYQFFNQKTFANKYLGLAEHQAQTLGVAVLENEEGRFLRAYGGVDHPNIFGALMFFAVIILINLILNSREKNLEKKPLSFPYLYYSLLAFFLLALVLSFSRSAFLALALSLLFYFFYFISQDLKLKKEKQAKAVIRTFRKKFLFLFSFIIIILLSFFLIYHPLILDRFDPSSRLEQISLFERQEQISLSRGIIKEHLYLGVGPGAYHHFLLLDNPGLKAYQAQPVHNVFLLILVEIGLWGFCFFLLFLYFFIKKMLNFQNISIFIGLFIFMLFDHWLFSLPFGLLFFFFLLSLTYYFKYDNLAD